jgi:hypothetical protein
MDCTALAENLGTIACSDTRAFGQILADAKPEERPSLIGQFGVGFYSALMVRGRGVSTRVRWGLLLALVLLLQGVLTSANAPSYWNDEFFSIYWSKLPLSWLWGEGFHVETTPPVYYTILHCFFALHLDRFADPRASSAVFSVLNTAVVYALVRQWFSRRAAIVAALILALLAANLHFAAEARAYALVQLLISVILLCLAILRSGWGPRVKPATVLVLAACLLVYVHTTTLLFLGVLFMLEVWHSRRRPRDLRVLTGVAFIVLAVAAPAVVNAVALAHAPGLAWIPRPQLWSLADLAGLLAVGPNAFTHNELVAVALSLPFVVVIPLVAYTRMPNPACRTVLFWFPLCCVAVVTLVSLVRSIFIFRIFGWLDSLVAINAAICLTTLAPGWRRSLLGAAVLAPISFGLVAHLTSGVGEDWRALVHDYRTSARPDDVVIIGPRATPFAWDFYGVPLPGGRLARWPGVDGVPPTAEDVLDRLYGRTTPISTAGIARALAKRHGVWLVLGGADWVPGNLDLLHPLEASAGFQDVQYGQLKLLHWKPSR